MRMLVTRPEPDTQATMDRLAALDIASMGSPLMTRQTLKAHFPNLAGFSALAVTSTNALRALVDLNVLPELLDKKVFAVGDRTAHEAKLLGFSDVTSAEGTLGSLVTAIALAKIDGPLLYPAGKHLSGDMAAALAPHGVMVATVPVYEMVAETALAAEVSQALATEEIGAVLVYSQRTASIFADLAASVLSAEQKRNLPMLCISENVGSALLAKQFSRILLADYPSEEAMMALALAFAREQTTA